MRAALHACRTCLSRKLFCQATRVDSASGAPAAKPGSSPETGIAAPAKVDEPIPGCPGSPAAHNRPAIFQFSRLVRRELSMKSECPSTILLREHGAAKKKLESSKEDTCTVKRRGQCFQEVLLDFFHFFFRYVPVSRFRGELPRIIDPVLGGCQWFPRTVLGLGKNGHKKKLQKSRGPTCTVKRRGHGLQGVSPGFFRFFSAMC